MTAGTSFMPRMLAARYSLLPLLVTAMICMVGDIAAANDNDQACTLKKRLTMKKQWVHMYPMGNAVVREDVAVKVWIGSVSYRVFVRACVCVSVCVRACERASVCACALVRMCVCVCVYMGVAVDVCVCVWVNVWVCVQGVESWECVGVCGFGLKLF